MTPAVDKASFGYDQFFYGISKNGRLLHRHVSLLLAGQTAMNSTKLRSSIYWMNQKIYTECLETGWSCVLAILQTLPHRVSVFLSKLVNRSIPFWSVLWFRSNRSCAVALDGPCCSAFTLTQTSAPANLLFSFLSVVLVYLLYNFKIGRVCPFNKLLCTLPTVHPCSWVISQENEP